MTKSTKRGGWCVAGIDAHTGEWIRLTTAVAWSQGALTDANMTCEDGTVCGILDCVQVEILRAAPIPHQPENVLINETRKFRRLGTWTFEQVLQLHPPENVATVYANTQRALTETEMGEVDRSLLLVRTRWLRINQNTDTPGKTKTRAHFVMNEGDWYNNISVTDPEYYGVEDDTKISPAYLVVSLPDVPFDNGLYYKYIAKIFPSPCPHIMKF